MVSECTNHCAAHKSHNCNPDHKKEDTKVELDKSPKPKIFTAENTEQAPEVSTSTADEVVLPAKSSEDVALILSAEEEAELCVNANEEVVKVAPKLMPEEEKPKELKKFTTKSVWVSNISRNTKAADLKKLFSEKFKVESAKIVTNGKSFFGYISLESTDMVQESVKALNGFNLSGQNIVVSATRPDLKTAKANVGEKIKLEKEKKRQANAKRVQQDSNNKGKENKQGEKDENDKQEVVKDPIKQNTEEKADKQEDEIKKIHRHEKTSIKGDKTTENLKKSLDTASSELRITKRRLKDANNRLEVERSRKAALIKEVSRLESQLKSERRRINQEREQEEKKRKLDELRYEADRAILNKELEECRKLREYLQTRVESRHRSRSPIVRSPVRRGGPSGRSLDKFQRSRALHVSPPRQRDYQANQERQRSPPPPPKLNKSSPTPRRNREANSPFKTHKKLRMEYPQGSYPSGSGAGNKTSLAHYPPSNNLNAPPRGSMWDSSYQMPYRYSPAPGQSAYPLIEGEVMRMPRPNTSRPLEYPEYHKKMSGGPRKY